MLEFHKSSCVLWPCWNFIRFHVFHGIVEVSQVFIAFLEFHRFSCVSWPCWSFTSLPMFCGMLELHKSSCVSWPCWSCISLPLFHFYCFINIYVLNSQFSLLWIIYLKNDLSFHALEAPLYFITCLVSFCVLHIS